MADGTITIDVDIQKNKVKSDVQAINEEVNKIGNKAGNKLDENLDKNLNKAKSKASQTGKEIDRNLGKDHKTKITVEDSEAKHKANELKSDLNKLPKDHKVKINAETGETTEKVDSVKHKINQLPEKHNTEINATDHTEGVFARIKSHFDKVNDEGKETHSIFKSVFSANIVSDAVKGGFSYIRGALGGMIGEAKQYALEQQTMNATWLTLTNSASKGRAMVNQINSMAAAAQNSTHMVDQLSQKFYAINNSAEQTGKLTKAVLTLQDAFGQSDAAVENFGTQFAQMMANGKVSAQDMMSIVNTFPKLKPMLLDYERQIHHDKNMTMSEMSDLMSKGKIKSQDMINVVLEAGKKFKKATGNFTATIPGMKRTIDAQMPRLLQSFEKPFVKMQSPIYGAVSKWVSSKKTENEFSKLGKTVSNGMSSVIKAFNPGKSVNVTKTLDNAINGIDKGLQGVFGWISGHAKDLKTIASSIASIGGQIAKAVWKDFASIITTIGNMFGLTAKNGKSSASAIHVIAEFLNHLAKNKLAIQAISKAIVAMAVVKGLDKVGGGLFAIGEKGYGAYKKLKALKGGLKGLKLAEEASKGEKAWYKFGKRLSSLPEIAKKAARGIKKTMNFSMGKRLAVGAVSGAAVAAPEIVNAVKDRHSADKRSQDIGGAVGALAGGTLTSMIPVVGPMLAPIGAVIGKYAGRWGGQAVNNFTKGWQRNKPPKHFWSLENLGYSAHNMWNGFTKGVTNTIKWFKKNWKEVGLYFISPLAGAINSLYKHNPKFRKWVKGLVKGFKEAWHGVGKWFGNIGKDIKKSWRGMTKFFSKLGSNMAKGLKKSWHSMTKFFSSIAKGVRNAWHNMTAWFGRLGRNAANGLKRAWRNIAKWFSSIYRGVTRAWHGLTSWFTNLGSNAVKGFKSAWHGLVSWFKGIIDGIKNAWDNFWDKISGPIKFLGKVFSGKASIGGIHFANGTDWRKRRDLTPAILNDGTDSPATHNRESIIHGDGSWELLPDIPFLRRFLLPGDDVVNAKDTANMFSRAYHFANGTVGLNKLTIDLAKPDKDNLNKILSTVVKQYNLDTTEATKRHQRERDKDAKERKRNATAKSGNAKERKDNFKWNIDNKRQKGDILIDKGLLTGARKETGKQTWINEKLFKRLMSYTKARPIKVSKHSRIRYRAIPAKRDGKDYLVDSHWLTGGKSNTGKLEKITREGFLKLLQFTKKERKYKLPKKKRKKTERKKTRKRRSSSRERESRSYSTRRSSSRRSYSSGSYSIGSASSRISASVSGLKEVRALSKAVKAIKGKKVKISAKASGTKSVKGLAKAVKAIKSKKRTVVVKAKGTKALKSLYRATKRIKGSTHKVRVKTYGESALKSLRKNISEVGKTAENLTKTLRGKGNFAKEIDKLVKSSDKAFKSLHSNATKSFKSMWSQLEKNTRSSERSITNQTNGFADKFRKQFRSIQNGIEKSFGHFWNSMKSEARKGLNGVIGVLNQAIGKIDNVVGQFGGSKSAVHKVQGLATGTGALGGGVRRPIVSPTWAILNDGNDSPETGNREAVWNRYTGNVDVIQGRFTPRYMRPGEEVFNATETKALGLTVPHFATGTGALKELYHIAKHNWEKPKQTGQALFSSINGLKGAINAIAQGANAKGEKAGVNWWSQLWKMVEDKVDDDDLGPASGLLKAVEKLGRGTTYSQARRYGPDSFDCSGLVSKAMNEYYHKNWGALTVAGLWPHAHRISKEEARPGDPIFWLPNYHVGVYAGHGMYYSAFSPNAHPQVGMHSIAESVPGVRPTYARFNGTNTEGNKSDKDVSVKANGKLQKQIKGQVGKGFWRTIQRIADKYGESNIPGTATPEQARRVIERAMDIAGVSGSNWLHGLETIAAHESSFRNVVNTWDSNARAGTPSAGWFQMIQSTFEANHKPGYNKWRNPLDQAISAIRYIKNKYGGINNVPGIVSLAHGGPYKGYARGGIVTNPQVALVGEGNGPESIIPWDPAQRDRALDIMLSTLTQFKAQDGKTQQFQQQGQQVVDLSQTNAEIQVINEKFDQALAALGILTSQNDVIQVNNYLDKNKIGEAMFSVMKRLNMRSTRNTRYNISGH
ncbi:SLT domain protein [Lactobacillus kitasatonis DSM 16761 = JCM 1039]|uniref:SLT domain protein n=2 Tax=Lactobacillus kitasatonis TaxID=237446 RepID=A0A0R1VS56_9LACO|nr:tape measure protein [Lactobacillus kitasatonis]KRM06699.1 SLT domain protein [Lactobacillus kitasatonis DSM 16761 = JCM 1039]